MKKCFVSILVLFLAIMSSFSVRAAGPEFSADYTMTDAKGKATLGKIYMKGEKIRQETVVDGQTSVSIIRLDKKLSWTLLADNQYMEVAVPFDSRNPEQTKDIQYDKTVIGEENINGYDCQVVQYTYKEKKYGILTQWISKKLQFAVRVQSKDAKGKVISTTDYANIKTSAQPAALFEIPDGYEKLALPFKLPGM